MVFAFAIAGLLGLAIFSLSKLNVSPWSASLDSVTITESDRKNLPEFEHEELTRLLNSATGENKWVLLSFWSYTCGPCLVELPTLNALAQAWQGPPFQILTINVDPEGSDEMEAAKNWILEEQIALPTIFDPQHTVKTAFKVDAYPTHFLISPAKEIHWQTVGAFNWNESESRDQLIRVMERQTPESQADPEE